MDYQLIYDNLPLDLKMTLRRYRIEDKENLLLVEAATFNPGKIKEILKEHGLKQQSCGRCYGRGWIGKNTTRKGEVVLCGCFMREIRKREGRLLVDWNIKEEEKNVTVPETIKE